MIQLFNLFLAGTKGRKLGYGCHEIKFKSVNIPSIIVTTTRSSSTYTPNPDPTQPKTTRQNLCTTTLLTPDCQISPSTGNTFTPFNVTCNIDQNFCCNGLCTLYMKTSKGESRPPRNITGLSLVVILAIMACHFIPFLQVILCIVAIRRPCRTCIFLRVYIH